MSSTSPTNVPVKACNFCRNSHTACDGERPCRRCVKRGLSDQCCDLAPRKKGRPARTDPRFRPKYPNGSNNAPNNNNNAKGQDGTTTTTTSSSPTAVPVTASDSRRCSTTSDSDTPTGQSWYTSTLPLSENEYDLEGARPGSNHSTTTTRYPFEHVDDAPYAVSEDDDSSEEEDEAGERSMASSEADLASKVIAMMADETHKLRKEVAKLRAKVKKLRKYKRLYEEQVCSSAPSSSYISSSSSGGQHTYGSHKRPRHDPASEGPVSPPSFVPVDPIRKTTSTDGASLPPADAGAECPSLVEARKHMAFLQHYRLPPDVPFVVGDMHSRPVFALEVPGMGQAISFAYTNEAFANMLQFSADELRRTPPGAVLSENVRLRDRMVRCLLNREPMAASEIFAMCPLMRRKDGRTLRGTCNMQFLFDSTGAVKHIICVTLHCEEDTRREHERFLEKVGSNALVVPASHTAASQHPQHQHQQLFNSTCAESAAVPPRSNAGGFDLPPPTAYASGSNAYWDWVLGQPQPLAAGPTTLGATHQWRA